MDGHMGLANSVALKLSGITNGLEDPRGGTIIRNPTGGNVGHLVSLKVGICNVQSWPKYLT